MEEPGTDRPEPSAAADIALITRGVTVTANVAESGSEVLVLCPAAGAPGAVTLKEGDLVEVYWAGESEERSLPARVAAVDEGDVPRWHLTVTGPTRRSQRRKAVRVAVDLPVTMPWAGGLAAGLTEDLSEAGLRARVDGWGVAPDPGTRIRLDVTLDAAEGALDVAGEVVRLQVRGAQWLLSVRFLDLTERDEDRLRRRVFAAMREERARAAAAAE